MSRNELSRLFDQLGALSVGFGPVFKDFQVPTNNYPPHNIVRVSDNEFYLELAVAGFKKTEVQMEEHQGLLTIRGDKKDALSGDTTSESSYQFRGIANRSFSKSFRIAEYFEVSNASLEDGILTVKFVRNVPEEAKPKLIAIK
jgi:molecular chaperone IbpA